jgi:urea transport system substrate-binding protein
MHHAATVAAEALTGVPVAETFGLFGQPGAASWLFGARCESVAPGTAVSMRLPFDPGGGRYGVDLLGRICEVRPFSRIAIEHDQPWRGRITLSFRPAGPHGTRVRVRAEVTASGVEWLMNRRGVSLPPEPTKDVRVGVLTSKSGPGAIYAMAAEYLAELAVEEVNGDGGIGGRRLELMVADDATDPAWAGIQAQRLVRAGCRAIFACTTSSSFASACRAVGHEGVLLVHPVINEGGSVASRSAARFGERPGSQVAALAPALMRDAGGRGWFMVGQEYSWSYGAHAAARRALGRADGRVIGEAYTPLGTTDFSRIIERIDAARPDIIMSSLVGSDEVAFQRQCAEAGLRTSTRALSLVMDESTYEHVGAAAARGVVTALGYFQDAAAAGNSDLLARYRARFGPWAPPVSSLSETVYEAVLRYASAVRADPDVHALSQHRALLEDCGTRRRGTAIGARDLLSQHLYLAEAGPQGLRVFDEVG